MLIVCLAIPTVQVLKNEPVIIGKTHAVSVIPEAGFPICTLALESLCYVALWLWTAPAQLMPHIVYSADTQQPWL